MRRAALAGCTIAAAAALASACRDPRDPVDENPATLTVDYVLSAAPNPLAGVSTWRVRVLVDGTLFRQADFGSNEEIVVGPLDPMDDVELILEGCDASGCNTGALSRGRTLAFDMTGDDQTVSMYFGRIDTWNVSNGAYTARAGPMAGRMADGSIVVAGGLESGVAGVRTDRYDWTADAITSAANLPAPQARGVAVSLDGGGALLFAGGVDETGVATDRAQVWLGSAWAASVPPMSEARLFGGGGSLGLRRALLVGGTNAATMTDTSEIFTWTGTSGTWIDGPGLGDPVAGVAVMPLGEGVAAFAGGYQWDPVEASREFRNDIEVVTSNGTGWIRTGVTNLPTRRGWPALIPVTPGTWLVAGGLRGPMPGAPEDTSDRLVWTGTTVAVSAGPDLIAARRLGGTGQLLDGRTLLIGGDVSPVEAALSPIADAELYDPVSDDFTEITPLPGPSSTAFIFALEDGTAVAITDTGIYRYVPP